jgi:hypothetical protein
VPDRLAHQFGKVIGTSARHLTYLFATPEAVGDDPGFSRRLPDCRQKDAFTNVDRHAAMGSVVPERSGHPAASSVEDLTSRRVADSARAVA